MVSENVQYRGRIVKKNNNFSFTYKDLTDKRQFIYFVDGNTKYWVSKAKLWQCIRHKELKYVPTIANPDIRVFLISEWLLKELAK